MIKANDIHRICTRKKNYQRNPCLHDIFYDRNVSCISLVFKVSHNDDDDGDDDIISIFINFVLKIYGMMIKLGIIRLLNKTECASVEWKTHNVFVYRLILPMDNVTKNGTEL